MIKLSAPDWCFFGKAKLKPAAYYGRLRELGITAVEMVDPGRWDAARAAGLEILNLAAPGMEVGLNRLEHHPELLPKIRQAIETAGANGIPQVIVFSGNRAALSDAEGVANCRAGLEDLLDTADAAKVTLAFEMLNSRDHKDYQADRGSFGFALAQQINSPRLRVLYDIYHMEVEGEESVADVTGNLELVAHLHVADARGRGLPTADGAIAYGHIVPPIVKAGYRGYWGLEFCPAGDVWAELKSAVDTFTKLGKA